MRICFFNRSYHPDATATGQLLTELAEDLVRDHRCEVTVVSGAGSRRIGGLVSREERRGVTIWRARGTGFSHRRFLGRAVNYVTYFLSACWGSLRVSRPDVVVSLTDPPIIGLAAWFTAKRTGARFVFLCEDIFPDVAGLLEDFHSRFVDALLDRVNRFLLRRADRIVALGRCMEGRLVDEKGADPEKVLVIENWADCKALAPGPKGNPFSRDQSIDQAFVVMHAGNLGLSQNLEVLIEAAGALADLPDLIFLFVGQGVTRPRLEAICAERGLTNVRFLDFLPRERMADSYAAADLFIVSLKEGIAGYIVPSKLYGILASGRPFIAAVEPLSEVARVASESGCGLLVPPGDPTALAEGVRTLYRDEAQRLRMGEAARRTGLRFDRSLQVEAYRNLFATLTSVARDQQSAQVSAETSV